MNRSPLQKELEDCPLHFDEDSDIDHLNISEVIPIILIFFFDEYAQK